MNAILFDAVGTLIYAEPSPAAVYAEVGRRHGATLPEDEISRRFRSAFAAEEARDRLDSCGRTDEARERRRWQAIVSAVFAETPNVDELFCELWQRFARPEAWRPYADAPPVVAELVRRGTMVAVASNFDARLGPIVATHFPEVASKRIFASSQLGYRKPAQNFFNECVQRLNNAGSNGCISAAVEPNPPTKPVAKQTSWFVGDDVDNDFHGARAAGLAALLLDRDGRHESLTPRIARLDELLGPLTATRS